MKTLLLTEVFPPQIGGSGRWLWELYRRMPRDEVVAAAGQTPGQEQFDRTHDLRLTRLPLTLDNWGTCNPRSLWQYGRALVKVHGLGKRSGAERIDCARVLPEGWIARLLHAIDGTPYCCYAHGEEFGAVASSRELTWMTHRVLGAVRLVIANSRNTAEILRSRWAVPAERIRILNPGVDAARYRPARRNDAVRKALGWDDRPVVLTVGRLDARKGHDRMIDATDQIRQTIPDALYCIVGDGKQRRALEERVRQRGLQRHVQFRGAADDDELLRCYQQCDLFALPNREIDGDFEGFGIVLLEAQACGKPVVAGDSGGTAETMRVPDTGRIVSCEHSGPLADTVLALLCDAPLRQAMGEAARRWIVERFDWEILCRQAREMNTVPSPSGRGLG